ncbi:MAG TPA: PfkB family carbohydrate kinase, partial [Candidatus Limnocylindria bacterium]|nr:PfkB family carbohydrate kinase [Candidatus Limnocylindria bacterium]
MNAPETLVPRLAGIRVAVIGDVMLDSYLDGYAGRLCREAPVPIVSVSERRDAPGGAANTAANVRSLGGEVRLLGITGTDDEAARLRRAMAAADIPHLDLLAVAERSTLAKQRVTAEGQLLLRFDTGSVEPPEGGWAEEIAQRVRELHAWADAIVISDYAYGVVSDAVLTALAELQARRRVPLVGDAKDPRRLVGARPAAVKPNYLEPCALLDLEPLHGIDRRAVQVSEHAERLAELTGAANVVVTLDGEGSVLLRPGEPPYRTYANAVSNDHAAGAGDTFAACLALAMAAGIEPPTGVELASAAAAVAVGKRGTATCTVDELLATV